MVGFHKLLTGISPQNGINSVESWKLVGMAYRVAALVYYNIYICNVETRVNSRLYHSV